MKALFFCGSVLFAGCVLAQKPNFSPEKFEKKLADFKYSLHPLLENLHLQGKKPDFDTIIAVKAQHFINQNQEEIKMYRQYSLAKYADTDFSFDNFQKDTIYLNPLVPISDEEKHPELKPIIYLLAINPFDFAFAQMQNTMVNYLYQKQGKTASEISIFYSKSWIGGIRRKYIPQSKENCLLIFDYYSLAFVCDFNLNTNVIKSCTVYIRKK